MKCFEELLTGLKFWKDFFFLIDRRAIPDAMPWRHKDSKISGKFPENFQREIPGRLLARRLFFGRHPRALCMNTDSAMFSGLPGTGWL